MASIYAIQSMALVHGLWIEHRVAGTISIEEVLGVFHGLIDSATNRAWKQSMQARTYSAAALNTTGPATRLP